MICMLNSHFSLNAGKLMSELKMSTGIAWYENELTNIVREGRSNTSVLIILIGVAQ